MVVHFAVQKKFNLDGDGNLLDDLDLPFLLAIAEHNYIIQILASGQQWTAAESVVCCWILFTLSRLHNFR